MNFDYLVYKETDDLQFSAKEKDFITFLGERNKEMVDNLIFKNKNTYITINYSKISEKTIDKLRKLLGFAGFDLLEIFLAETVKDELAYGLESLALNKNEMLERIDKNARLFKLSDILEKSPKSLTTSEKAKLAIARILITEPKVLVIDNLLSFLDFKDFKTVVDALKEYQSKGTIILNFTTEIEETLLGDKIIITDKEKIILSGSTISVLNEEKIMKRLGYNLPFIVLLNKYLKDYDLIKNFKLDYEGLVETIWK